MAWVSMWMRMEINFLSLFFSLIKILSFNDSGIY